MGLNSVIQNLIVSFRLLRQKIKKVHSKRVQLNKELEAERKMLLAKNLKDNKGGKSDGAAGGSD